jgi:hypothetical protein
MSEYLRQTGRYGDGLKLAKILETAAPQKNYFPSVS